MHNTENAYLPAPARVLEVIRHTALEYTFRLAYTGDVRPGQFFEVSIPKFGEAPISVSGVGPDHVDFTIRRVGRVTDEIFERYEGAQLFLRGPYGNGFDVSLYRGRELVVVAGGTGLSPVRGVVEHFAAHPEETAGATLIAGFKSPADILFRDDLARWERTMRVVLTVDSDPEETGCRTGLVTQYIPDLEIVDKAAARAIVVGPPVMMRFAAQALLDAGLREENIWISHERRMCCGIGKCGHCRINNAYVCLDGPVFRLDRGRDLQD